MKRWCAVAAVVVLWSLGKIFWEGRLAGYQEARDLRPPITVSSDVRDSLGQGLTLAALAGFRSVVAHFSWLNLIGAWQEQQWSRVNGYAELVVMMQPRVAYYWEHGAWHLGWNASASVLYSSDYPEHQRRHLARRWHHKGRRFLERGIAVLPNEPKLYVRLAELYLQKLNDYYQAAEYYRLASELPGAPEYARRFVGYAYQRAGDEEAEYRWWKKIWGELSQSERDSRKWENIKKRLLELESKSND